MANLSPASESVREKAGLVRIAGLAGCPEQRPEKQANPFNIGKSDDPVAEARNWLVAGLMGCTQATEASELAF